MYCCRYPRVTYRVAYILDIFDVKYFTSNQCTQLCINFQYEEYEEKIDVTLPCKSYFHLLKW